MFGFEITPWALIIVFVLLAGAGFLMEQPKEEEDDTDSANIQRPGKKRGRKASEKTQAVVRKVPTRDTRGKKSAPSLTSKVQSEVITWEHLPPHAQIRINGQKFVFDYYSRSYLHFFEMKGSLVIKLPDTTRFKKVRSYYVVTR